MVRKKVHVRRGAVSGAWAVACAPREPAAGWTWSLGRCAIVASANKCTMVYAIVAVPGICIRTQPSVRWTVLSGEPASGTGFFLPIASDVHARTARRSGVQGTSINRRTIEKRNTPVVDGTPRAAARTSGSARAAAGGRVGAGVGGSVASVIITFFSSHDLQPAPRPRSALP